MRSLLCRAILSGLVTAVLVGACASDDGGGADSAFCGKARATMALDPADQHVDDPAALRDAWAAYLEATDAAAASAPGSIDGDYERYAGWIHTLGAALDRHDYDLSVALGDEALVAAMRDEAVEQARTSVETYLAETCTGPTSSE